MNQENLKTNEASNNYKMSENYHALSKLDLKILIREIDESFSNFLSKNNLNKNAKLFLSGRNSQHNNLVEILGESLKMDVSVISPINNYLVKEFSYNPDEINHFAMSRLVGLGLTLLKKNKFFNKYFLTSIPKKNIDIVLEAIKNANLKICTLQMSHMCIANLLKTEIDKIKDNDLIISVDLLD